MKRIQPIHTIEDHVRNQFETETIYRYFVCEREKFFPMLMEGKGEMLCRLLDLTFSSRPSIHTTYACPYSEKDFQVRQRIYFKEDMELWIVQILLPIPEQYPLCRAIYLCALPDHSKISYYRSELTLTGNFALCRQLFDGTKWFCEYAPKEVETEFHCVSDLFYEELKCNMELDKYEEAR